MHSYVELTFEADGARRVALSTCAIVCLRHLSATASYVAYRTYSQDKQADINRVSVMAISLTEPVLLVLPAIFAA